MFYNPNLISKKSKYAYQFIIFTHSIQCNKLKLQTRYLIIQKTVFKCERITDPLRVKISEESVDFHTYFIYFSIFNVSMAIFKTWHGDFSPFYWNPFPHQDVLPPTSRSTLKWALWVWMVPSVCSPTWFPYFWAAPKRNAELM